MDIKISFHEDLECSGGKDAKTGEYYLVIADEAESETTLEIEGISKAELKHIKNCIELMLEID